MRAKHLVHLLTILVLVFGAIGMTSSYTAAAMPERDVSVDQAPLAAAAGHCYGMAQGNDQGEDGHTPASMDCRAVCALILCPSLGAFGAQMFGLGTAVPDVTDIFSGVTLEIETPPPRSR